VKIALVMYHFDESKGGMEAYVANFSRQLVAHGHEVHVFTGNRRTEVPEIIFHDVPVMRFWSPLRDITFAVESARMLQKESYDVIHGFSRTYYQDVFRIAGGCHAEYLRQTHQWTATRWGKTLIELNPRDRAVIALERKTFRKGNYLRLTANSGITRQEVVDEFGVPPDDITVIYNPVDAERFAPERIRPYRASTRERLGIGTHEIAVLFVGIGWARKGLRYLIEALASLGNDRMKLVVVGSGDVRSYCRMAGPAGIKDRVLFPGRTSRVEEYYAAADIFALPTLHDAFPNVVMEAMAASLPVLSTRFAGTSEIATHGRDSLIVRDPRDVPSIAACLKELLEPPIRRSIGAAARDTALKYTWKENYRRTLEVYDEVAQAKRAGGDRRRSFS
jgi:UDP-glucose:(heptosyl)LPS alpha-1,3-glucosyltransferase